MKRLLPILVLLAALFAAHSASACAVCYGDTDAPMSKGLTWAITAMVGFVAVVLTGVTCFFVHTVKHSADADRPDDSGTN